MNTNLFFDHPDYCDYVKMTYQLHVLIREDRDETDEGYDLRDRMDAPAFRLSAVELESAGDISADLYSLSDPPHQALPMPEDVAKELEGRQRLIQSRRFHLAFDLLRKHEKYITPARRAYYRGTIWKAIGEEEIADDFFRLAWKYVNLDPNDILPSFSALIVIDHRLALSEAEKIVLRRTNENPINVLTALNVLIQIRRQFGDHDAGLGLDSFPHIYEETICRLQSVVVNRNWLAGVYFFLGFCREELGQTEQALDAYNRGISNAPVNHLLLSRGRLLYAVDPDQALRDFQQTISNHIEQFVPYYFLAHHALIEDRFKECLDFCEQAMRFDPPGQAKANLTEWIAICKASLDDPDKDVAPIFDEAVRLDPENLNIKHNYQIFRENPAPRASSLWHKEDTSTVLKAAGHFFQPAA